jgi:putative photosynthetic complex assembly protein
MSQTSTITPAHSNALPRGVLLGASALVIMAVILTCAARMSDIGTLHMPKEQAVQSLSLRFEDRYDGSVAVVDASDGKIIYTVAPGTNGFIRATVRGLAQEREREGIGRETPFTLTHWSDGTMSLADSAIGRRISLDAFGPTNAGAFAQLFSARSSAQ